MFKNIKLVKIISIICILMTFALPACSKKEVIQEQIFLRGSFNNWGTDTAFKLIGDEYAAQVRLSEGSHAFKIADSNWAAVNLGAEESFTIEIQQEVNLFSAGKDIFINVFEPESDFVFLLKQSADKTSYSLTVLRGTLNISELPEDSSSQ